MQLQTLSGTYSVLQYLPRTATPDWVYESEFHAICGSPDELSVVCESSVVRGKSQREDKGWRCFRVVGTLDFSLSGVLHSIAAPLAEEKISIFAVSTFNTDYVFVKETDFIRAEPALVKAGFSFDAPLGT
jgi:uncharacterized protein